MNRTGAVVTAVSEILVEVGHDLLHDRRWNEPPAARRGIAAAQRHHGSIAGNVLDPLTDAGATGGTGRETASG